MDCRVGDAFRFLRTTWPRCCGEVMALRIRLPSPEYPSGDDAATGTL